MRDVVQRTLSNIAHRYARQAVHKQRMLSLAIMTQMQQQHWDRAGCPPAVRLVSR
jgi:hypothetical protein